MSSRALDNIPLASKNRLGYTPPGTAISNNPKDLHLSDMLPSEPRESPTQPSQSLASKSFASIISTSYSLFLVAFFNSLVETFWPTRKERKSEHTRPELRDGDELALGLGSGFPGESTPLNTTLIDIADFAGPDIDVCESPSISDTDANWNLYHSIFELDSSDSDDLDIDVQYGMSLKFSESSAYKPNAKLEPASMLQDEATATEILDTEFPTLDEYDKVVHNFYTPIRPVPPAKYSLTDAMLAAIPSYDFSQFLRKERQGIQAIVSEERKASQSKITPLSAPQLALVESKWKAGNSNERVVSDFSIDITVKDIHTLKDSCWLNDNVIDFYLSLVAARSTGVFCWTTHFFTTLKNKGYQGVARWAKRKKVNLLEKDLVVIPINIMSTHWAVAVIDNNAKLISYYDSLASRGNLKAVQLLSGYMSKECERLLVPPFAYTLHPNAKTPQQQNGFDCGVFSCTVAKCISERMPLSFSQNDMRLIRRKMAYEIITNNLLGGAGPGPHL